MKEIKDQTIIITGATDGIGKIAALKLARQNAHIVIHGRRKEKVEAVVKELIENTANKKIDGWTADLSSLEEVKRSGAAILAKYPSIDVFINNAGVGFADTGKSREGYELRFAVNYLAPFLLTKLVLPAIKHAAPSRIVNVSSAGQAPVNFDHFIPKDSIDPVLTYRESKLALIMFTIDLAEEVRQYGVTVNSLHPGTYLNTNMVRNAKIKPMGDAESGADAEVFLATSPSLNNVTGKYFNVTKEARALPQAYDPQVRWQLRNYSMDLINTK
ncbi:MAG TPA: SDR family oxidoreductase [Chitinophagaceae bacterium]|nr:SDR family oxidoreductase [Chitinophagaceae bacterium]